MRHLTSNPKPRAEFVASAFSVRDFPRQGIPEVVLAGRSNVGKSCLVNRLAGESVARTSSTPGKTQSINFYRFNDAFYLVDLPGYGYAKASKAVSRNWRNLVDTYFRERSAISLVIHLVDSRIPPTRLDSELGAWLNELRIPRILVATKADKLSGNGRASQTRLISESLGVESVLMASSVTGMGLREIWKRVEEAALRD